MLYLAHLSDPFIVPAGDEGGGLVAGVDAQGTIQPGDLDRWRFSVCKGDPISIRVDSLTATNYFNPWLRLYSPSGILIADSGSGNLNASASVTLTSTNSGTFVVLLSDGSYGTFSGSGDYRLTCNGLYEGLRGCIPFIAGTNETLGAVGGGSNATYVLFTHTNLRSGSRFARTNLTPTAFSFTQIHTALLNQGDFSG